MVWVGGSQGTLAPCLVDLFLEADRLWPKRSRASDGTLGDTAHASRTSDHNAKSPNPPGWVDAADLTDDKAHGCDADLLAHHLVASRDPRVKYVIWNGTVVRSYDKPGLRAWTPEPYTGENRHVTHTHISVTEAGRFIRRPWFPSAAPPPVAPEETVMFVVRIDEPGHARHGTIAYSAGPGHWREVNPEQSAVAHFLCGVKDAKPVNARQYDVAKDLQLGLR